MGYVSPANGESALRAASRSSFVRDIGADASSPS